MQQLTIGKNQGWPTSGQISEKSISKRRYRNFYIRCYAKKYYIEWEKSRRKFFLHGAGGICYTDYV